MPSCLQYPTYKVHSAIPEEFLLFTVIHSKISGILNILNYKGKTLAAFLFKYFCGLDVAEGEHLSMVAVLRTDEILHHEWTRFRGGSVVVQLSCLKLRRESMENMNGLFSKEISVADGKIESAEWKFYYVFQIFFLNRHLRSLKIHPEWHADFCFWAIQSLPALRESSSHKQRGDRRDSLLSSPLHRSENQRFLLRGNALGLLLGPALY